MAGTAIDQLGWEINLILTIFLDPLVQGINRILRQSNYRANLAHHGRHLWNRLDR